MKEMNIVLLAIMKADFYEKKKSQIQKQATFRFIDTLNSNKYIRICAILLYICISLEYCALHCQLSTCASLPAQNINILATSVSMMQVPLILSGTNGRSTVVESILTVLGGLASKLMVNLARILISMQSSSDMIPDFGSDFCLDTL